jgi:hypothetical protein
VVALEVSRLGGGGLRCLEERTHVVLTIFGKFKHRITLTSSSA